MNLNMTKFTRTATIVWHDNTSKPPAAVTRVKDGNRLVDSFVNSD